MSSSQLRRGYRHILREVSRAYVSPKAERSKTIPRALKAAITSLSVKQTQNIHTFLRAHRLHKVLVTRYNPGGDLTAEERIKATARRVGLDVPKELDLDVPLKPTGKGGKDS